VRLALAVAVDRWAVAQGGDDPRELILAHEELSRARREFAEAIVGGVHARVVHFERRSSTTKPPHKARYPQVERAILRLLRRRGPMPSSTLCVALRPLPPSRIIAAVHELLAGGKIRHRTTRVNTAMMLGQSHRRALEVVRDR
jgi:hypothetical protein